jgi:hypothetical protein
MVASILLITFETYHGNQGLALAQIESSVQLLENWTAQPERSSGERVSSPAPDTVEDELIKAFDRFEIEAMIFNDISSVEQHSVRKHQRTAAVLNIPEIFTHIDEASA